MNPGNLVSEAPCSGPGCGISPAGRISHDLRLLPGRPDGVPAHPAPGESEKSVSLIAVFMGCARRRHYYVAMLCVLHYADLLLLPYRSRRPVLTCQYRRGRGFP